MNKGFYELACPVIADLSFINASFTNEKHLPIVEELFNQCYHDHFNNLCGYAFTIVKDNDEAKDIVQSAFIKLWLKRNEVNIRTSAKSYLFTSVYHSSLNAVRDKKTKEKHTRSLSQFELLESSSGLEGKEALKRILSAIESLPPRCKEVFRKSRFEELKYAEIATEMNISVKTVEVQMGKALKTLRETLADMIILLGIIFSSDYLTINL